MNRYLVRQILSRSARTLAESFAIVAEFSLSNFDNQFVCTGDVREVPRRERSANASREAPRPVVEVATGQFRVFFRFPESRSGVSNKNAVSGV